MSVGISKTTFVVGIVVAILASSVLSAVVSMQFAKGPKGDKGDTGETGPQGLSVADYDSGWINITNKTGQYFNVTHNLNNTDIVVDIIGKTTVDGGVHQVNLGGTVVQKIGQTYGYPLLDEARYVVQTSDGGYAIVGSASPGWNSDFWLVKTDSEGNMQWNRTYGGKNGDSPYSLIQCDDGGYAMAGYTSSFGAGDIDFYLVKTDSSGNMEWNKTYGSTGQDIAYSVIQANDGGYAIAGHTYAFGGGDFWLFKTTSAGDMQWNKTYGGSSDDRAYSVVQTADGGYAMAGQTYSFGAGGADFWLVKTDANGNEQWNRTYGGADLDSAKSLVITSDGGFALAGQTSSYGAGGGDFWVVKTQTDGNMQWNKTFGGKGGDYAESIVQTADGSYVIVGWTSSFGAGLYDYWVVKTDSNGILEWAKTYGSQWKDFAYSVAETDDGGYVIAGSTGSTSEPTGDFWVIKINTNGNHEWIQNHLESGLVWTNSTNDMITLHRGATDQYWNYVRVRIWKPKTP